MIGNKPLGHGFGVVVGPAVKRGASAGVADAVDLGRLVGMVIAGLIGYEVLNLPGNHPFDLNDVLATLVFGAATVFVYARILAKYGRNTADNETTTEQ